MLRIVEDYSRQVETKSKEIGELTSKLVIKKTKMKDLKKRAFEMEQKDVRQQSKLDNMKKFSSIFIKSMKSQNTALREHVLSSQKDFQAMVDGTKSQIALQIETKLVLATRQNELLLEKEREHVSELTKLLETHEASYK